MTVLVEREIFDSDTSEAYLTPTDNTEIADKKDDDEETSSKAESDPSTPVLEGSIHENNVEKIPADTIDTKEFSKNELSESIKLVDKEETLNMINETDELKEESPKAVSAESVTDEKIEQETKVEPVIPQDIEPIKKEIIFNHETQLKETKIEHVESNVILKTVKENNVLIESDNKEPIVQTENVDKNNSLETEAHVLVKDTIVNNNIAVIESILKEEVDKDNRNNCDSDVISSQAAPNSPTKLSVDTASPQHDLSTPVTPAKVPDAIASSDAASTTTEAASPSQEEAPSGGPPSRVPSLGAIPDETIAVESQDPIIADNQSHRMSPHKRPHSSSTSTQVDPVHFG